MIPSKHLVRIVSLSVLMPVLTLHLILSWATSAHSSEELVSPDVQEVIGRIQEIDMVQGPAVNYAGERPEQYDNFVELMAKATSSELRTLTAHSNGAVRCYAIWALSKIDTVDVYPIVLDHLSDNESVTTQFGCIVMDEKVGDFFISLVTPEYVDLEVTKLTDAQFFALDSILIFGSFDLYARDKAIERAEPEEFMYDRLRELVIDENNESALISLARYRREQDIELILASCSESDSEKRACYSTYRAITNFPHDDFRPLLRSAVERTLDKDYFSNEWRAMFKAIAAYEDQKAAHLLEVPFTGVKHKNIRQYHIDFVYEAVRDHKVQVFDSLLWRLWLEERRITPDVFEYLRLRDEARLFESAKVALRNLEEPYLANISLNFSDIGATENVVTSMLNMVLVKDSIEAIELIAQNIKSSNVHVFPIFADVAERIQSQEFVEVLLVRLETEWNAHVYLKAAKALIAYGDDEINRRVVEARQKNSNLSDGWGGEAFTRLLSENGLE